MSTQSKAHNAVCWAFRPRAGSNINWLTDHPPIVLPGFELFLSHPPSLRKRCVCLWLGVIINCVLKILYWLKWRVSDLVGCLLELLLKLAGFMHDRLTDSFSLAGVLPGETIWTWIFHVSMAHLWAREINWWDTHTVEDCCDRRQVLGISPQKMYYEFRYWVSKQGLWL